MDKQTDDITCQEPIVLHAVRSAKKLTNYFILSEM